MDIKALLSQVKAEITPSKEEESLLKGVAGEIVSKLSSKGLNAMLLGSVAKGTFLKGNTDLDIFVFFPKTLTKDEMAEKLFSALEELSIPYEKKYAEHPYARVSYKGINADVVPAYETKEGEVLSAVDRSYWHYKFMEKHLTNELRGEVRLLKAFLKNLNLYGAEAYRRGFSGYLCELLTIHFGGFLPFLKAAASWKPPILVAFRKPERAFDHPLIVVDPTDGKRNVAAVVSLENLALLTLLARSFLSKPHRAFFFIDELSFSPPLDTAVIIRFPKPKEVEEIRLSQLRRIEEAVKNWLSNYLLVSLSLIYEEGEEAIIALETKATIPSGQLKKGPPVWSKHASSFTSKNDAFLYEDRLYAYKTHFSSLKEAVEHFLSTYPLPSHYRGLHYRVEELKKPTREVERALKIRYLAMRWMHEH